MSRDYTVLVRTKKGHWSQVQHSKKGRGFTIKASRGYNPPRYHFEHDEAMKVQARAKSKGWSVEVAKGRHYPWLILNPGAQWPTDKRLLKGLNAVAMDLHRRVKIISGYRSEASQTRLYQLYRAGRGNLAAPSPPCRSQHCLGKSADCGVIGSDGAYRSMLDHPGTRALLHKHSLVADAQGEHWHISFQDGSRPWRA